MSVTICIMYFVWKMMNKTVQSRHHREWKILFILYFGWHKSIFPILLCPHLIYKGAHDPGLRKTTLLQWSWLLSWHPMPIDIDAGVLLRFRPRIGLDESLQDRILKKVRKRLSRQNSTKKCVNPQKIDKKVHKSQKIKILTKVRKSVCPILQTGSFLSRDGL